MSALKSITGAYIFRYGNISDSLYKKFFPVNSASHANPGDFTITVMNANYNKSTGVISYGTILVTSPRNHGSDEGYPVLAFVYIWSGEVSRTLEWVSGSLKLTRY